MSDTIHRAADPAVIAEAFAESVKGVLEQGVIDRAVASLKATTAGHSANGSVASMIFYLTLQVIVDGGKTFDGQAGGISSSGGGALFGTVYTDDLDALYARTQSFQFNATPVFLNINFFDGHANLLGHFEAGGTSTVLGTGGGKGSWS